MPTAKYTFRWQNNRIDPLNIPMDPDSRTPTFTEWSRLVNVDTDNFNGCALRSGYQLAQSATNAHSLWSNPYNPREAYYVEDTTLKMRSLNGVVTILRQGITAGMRMFFAQVNDVVWYSNGVERGIIELGVALAPFIPADPFKLPMVAGRCVEWFNGRLYTGVSENGAHALVCSDSLDVPGGIESMDDRTSIVAHFDSPVTMIQRIDAGLFVGTERDVFFFTGEDPFVEEGFKQHHVDNHGAVLGTNIPVKAELTPAQGRGFGAFWVAGDRVCFAAPTGELAFDDKLALPIASEGYGCIREVNGAAHYLFTLSGVTDTANTFTPRNIDVTEN